MKFTPPKNKKGRHIAFFCILASELSVLFAILSRLDYALLIQIVALFLFFMGALTLLRYEFTTFTYLITKERFVVLKRIGKKETCVCNLDLTDAIAITKRPKKKTKRRKWEKEHGSVFVSYNFAQVVRPKHAYLLLFSFHGKTAEIFFEPSEAMATLLERQIAENEKSEFF